MKQDPDVPRLAALIKESGLSDQEIICKDRIPDHRENGEAVSRGQAERHAESSRGPRARRMRVRAYEA